MADVKWIKIVTDIFNDEKILLIENMPDADSVIVVWFKLLCLAGKQNNSGVFMMNEKIAYTDEMLATIFRRPLNTVRLALSTFEKFGMIEIVNSVITIPKWDKHQSLDSLEQRKEYMRNLMAEKRRKQKEKTDVSTSTANTLLTVSTLDKNKIREEQEGEKEYTPKPPKGDEEKSRFSKPTADEVKAYCHERKNKVDAQAFVDFYESKGWLIGKNKMKDWKAAVRTWERGSNSNEKPPKKDFSMYKGTVLI